MTNSTWLRLEFRWPPASATDNQGGRAWIERRQDPPEAAANT